MSYEVSYKGDNTGRRAINDLCRWFGLRRSILIIREMRACYTFADIDAVDMCCGFGGVTGEPVRRLIAHVHGEDALRRWSDAPRGSKALIRDAAYR